MKRWLLVVFVMCIALFTSLLVILPAVNDDPPDTADAGGLCWSAICEKVNRSRVAHNREPLRQRDGISDVADAWARTLATTRVLKHNPQLTLDVNNWTLIAENVGYGPDVTAIHESFMDSKSHRSNILDRRFKVIGVGKERDVLGTLWVVQVFKRPK